MKYFFLLITLLCGFSTKQSRAALSVGAAAPQISSQTQDMKKLNLAESFKKSKYTLVYFYPKADTPGCTAQANSLKEAYPELQKRGVTIYGVSTDSIGSLRKFRAKYKIPFDFLSDPGGKVAQAFGVPVRSGFASRQAFLISNSKIIWKDESASTAKQAEDVLNFLK